jgi:hypothetical protein
MPRSNGDVEQALPDAEATLVRLAGVFDDHAQEVARVAKRLRDLREAWSRPERGRHRAARAPGAARGGPAACRSGRRSHLAAPPVCLYQLFEIVTFKASPEHASRAIASPAAAWALLEGNAALPGGARLGVGARAEVWVRADVPIDAGVDLGRRLAGVCRDLEAAWGRLGATGRSPAPVDSPIAVPTVAPAALAEACRSAEWRVRERAGGLLAVDLEVPGAFPQATVGCRGGGLVAEVALFDDPAGEAPPLADPCRHALATLLLRTSGIVRMVRAAAGGDGPDPRPRLEVCLPELPSAAELSHAFGALSVACGIAAREALVLRHDDEVAERYVRRWTHNQEEDRA